MITLADLPHWLTVSVAVPLGLLFGSFLNVVIHRLPRDENIAYPASHCPACGAPIRPYDNIPIVSWLLLRGKARCCQAPISPRYPFVEMLGALAAWAVLELVVAEMAPTTPWYGALAAFALHLALALGLIASIFIDLEFMILPDEITLGGAALGVLSVPLRSIGWVESLAGAAVGFLVVWLPFIVIYQGIRGHPGMGLGDAKLLMLAGAWFGWPGAVFALLAGAVQGTFVALTILVLKGSIEEPEAVRRQRQELRDAIERAEGQERADLEEELARDPLGTEAEEGIGRARLAFGPFLALATLEYLLFGDAIVNRYVSWLLSA